MTEELTPQGELRFFLQQGRQSVKELARLTGRSVSAIYKALGKMSDVNEAQGDNGKVFWLNPTEAPNMAKEPTATAESTLPLVRDISVSPAPSTGRGRPKTGAGKKLFAEPSLLQQDHESVGAPGYINTRRAGSHGYRSLQIVIDNPGITTEEYVAKGGRMNDLRWDLAHGNVRMEG